MDFKKQILGEEIEKDKYKDIVENIIKWKTIYDDDSKMMKKMIEREYPNVFSKDQIKKICRFKYSGWGNFSLSFLNGIRGADRETGENFTIIEALWKTNYNLMQLLSKQFTFREEIDLINADKVGKIDKVSYDNTVKDLIVSPANKRAIWQTVQITEEIKKEALQAEEQKVNDEGIDEITQEQNTKIINQQNEVEKTNNNPSVNINWKKVKIAVIIVVIAAIVIGGIVFALNFKKMQINKANKLIEQTQYSEAVKVLEKYKDDDDVKKLYDDAAYMASDEGQFLTAFAKGLMQRWELNLSTPDTNDSATYIANMQKLINAELNEISKYRDVTFSDDTFNQKAHDYINDLDKQKINSTKTYDFYTIK